MGYTRAPPARTATTNRGKVGSPSRPLEQHPRRDLEPFNTQSRRGAGVCRDGPSRFHTEVSASVPRIRARRPRVADREGATDSGDRGRRSRRSPVGARIASDGLPGRDFSERIRCAGIPAQHPAGARDPLRPKNARDERGRSLATGDDHQPGNDPIAFHGIRRHPHRGRRHQPGERLPLSCQAVRS